MKLILVCTLFVGLSTAHDYEVGRPGNLNCNCGWKNADSDEKTYPWVVPILAKEYGSFMCAGTLLTEFHVITSANCLIARNPKEIVVCIGSKNRSTCSSTGIKHDLDSIYTKSGYDSTNYKNNLSMAITKKKITFSKTVGPACFPTEKILNANFVGTDLIFLGWGGTVEVRNIDFEVKKQTKCQSLYPLIKEDTHICAGSKTLSNKNGDVGGSFVMLHSNTQRYTIVGVLNRIYDDAYNSPVPSVLTNITTYIDWISDKVSGKSKAYLCYKI